LLKDHSTNVQASTDHFVNDPLWHYPFDATKVRVLKIRRAEPYCATLVHRLRFPHKAPQGISDACSY
jgi:hypothetical protein